MTRSAWTRWRSLSAAIASLLAVAVVDAARVQSPSWYREAPPEIQNLVRDAIADRFQAGDIPDINLLPDRGHVYVLREMQSAKLQLTQRALPTIRGCRFELTSWEDAEAVAGRTRRDFVYITLDSPHIDTGAATISMGVDFAAADRTMLKMCCCTGHAEFRRTADRWRFAKWTAITCS